MNINLKATAQSTYDAIVIGSGISGGIAAKELCQKGLKTLLLERGRNVEHSKDYITAFNNPWDFENRIHFLQKEIDESPILLSNGEVTEANVHFFVKDKVHPYIQEKPFCWMRGYQVGGRSLVWGRQSYRWSDLDFGANAKDGHGVDWPVRYKDIEPWYDYIENYIGVSGTKEGLSQLPDGNFLPGFELNVLEKHLAQTLKSNYDRRVLTIARVANLTRGWDHNGPCQARNLCSRGCPFGGYYSSNRSAIPNAAATGNLTLRPFSVVSEIIYDANTQKAKGVRVIDSETKEVVEFYAKIIFLNASTINSAAILLNSTSNHFPTGLGNSSGQIGRNLMDHHAKGGAKGHHMGYKDHYYSGRRPCGFYIPRYRNLEGQAPMDFVRGYGVQGHGERAEWMDKYKEIDGVGKDFKEALTTPGDWTAWLCGYGECLPYEDNRITLDNTQKDQWGMPLIRVNMTMRENEEKMADDARNTCAEMLEKAGFKNIEGFKYDKPPGMEVHEMGTIRMGKDPKTSAVNRYNQLHDVKNVFVTDGSFMASSGWQNPSLTYMAFTARACDFAADALKKGDL